MRFTLAAILMVSIRLALRLALPQGSALLGAELFGLLQLAGAFGFFYFALTEIGVYLGSLRTKTASPSPAEDPPGILRPGIIAWAY